jgi:hypothetical protein
MEDRLTALFDNHQRALDKIAMILSVLVSEGKISPHTCGTMRHYLDCEIITSFHELLSVMAQSAPTKLDVLLGGDKYEIEITIKPKQ